MYEEQFKRDGFYKIDFNDIQCLQYHHNRLSKEIENGIYEHEYQYQFAKEELSDISKAIAKLKNSTIQFDLMTYNNKKLGDYFVFEFLYVATGEKISGKLFCSSKEEAKRQAMAFFTKETGLIYKSNGCEHKIL